MMSYLRPVRVALLASFVLGFVAPRAWAVDFSREIQPILESACVRCHNSEKSEGELNLASLAGALQGGESGPALVPGKPDESPLLALTLLAADDDSAMPPKGPSLAKSQTDRLQEWIAAGAPWPADVTLTPQTRIDFVKHIQPILEENCLACHSSTKSEGDLNLSTLETAFSTGTNAPVIVPFDANKSLLYSLTVLTKEAEELMPPANKGGPLKKELTEQLRLWINQGAVWPAGITLKPKAKGGSGPPSPDNMELVQKIHALILERSAESSAQDMKDYDGKVPSTGAPYSMVALPGGEFLMGSPEQEAKRKPTEGPQTKVTVEPFWIGKYEVTWDEYEPFMITKVDRYKNGARKDYDPSKHSLVDAVSQPTAPYTEMSFGMGQKGFPAISMTEHGANKYCEWLSAQTGHFYRLATEAEWEYACRAGTSTAFSWGDDPDQAAEYAWFYDNANEKYQKVGKKKPNPWGIHDMHGNVMEWVADRYEPNYFELIQGAAHNPFLKPDKIYPRSVRGGSWNDDPDLLRSAARLGSDPVWKHQDPQLPKSIWYHTDAKWLGFRIVRPLKVPTVEEMYFYWNSATNKL